MAETERPSDSAQETKARVAIDNVRIFDGSSLSQPTTVVIDGDVIGFDPTDVTEHIDGGGGTLLPGLIESHCHPGTLSDVQSLTRYGVTTAFMLATYGPRNTLPYHGHDGLVDIHYASAPAAAPGSLHENLVKRFNDDPSLIVQGPEDAPRWVREQITWEPEFVKLIAQSPGHSQETLDILVREGHQHGRKVLCHAADLGSHRQAMLAGVDQIHHSPSDTAADEGLALEILRRGQICVPTLSIMKALATGGGPFPRKGDYAASRESVRLYHQAQVPILVGTDANNAIAAVPFGESMHGEMELLVEAGLSPTEVLRSATSLAAKHWGLEDRGVIAAGKRADLVLVDGDPTVDIKATRNLRRVWVAGQEYKDKLGGFDA